MNSLPPPFDPRCHVAVTWVGFPVIKGAYENYLQEQADAAAEEAAAAAESDE